MLESVMAKNLPGTKWNPSATNGFGARALYAMCYYASYGVVFTVTFVAKTGIVMVSQGVEALLDF